MVHNYMMDLGGLLHWYTFPVLAALLFKLWLLLTVSGRPWVSAKWICFVVLFFFHNLVELSLLIAGPLAYVEFLLRVYYVAATSVILCGVFYVLNDVIHWQKILGLLLVACAAIIAILIFGSDLLIYGAIPFVKTAAAIKGPLFGLFLAYAVVGLASIVVLAVYNRRYWSRRDRQKELEQVYSLVALMPLLIITGVIVCSLMFDWGISPVMVIPIGSTMFLLITANATKTTKAIRDIRLRVPFSVERSVQKQIDFATAQYWAGNINHKEYMFQIERANVEYMYHRNQQSARRTIDEMGIPRSSFYSAMERLLIPLKDKNESANDD